VSLLWSLTHGGAPPIIDAGGMSRRARQAVMPLSMVAAEAAFERELEVFRTEAAAQFFHAFLAIHATAAAKKPILDHINRTPLF
jgi:hypothetical protein